MDSLEILKISVEKNVETMLIFGMENVNVFQATIELIRTQLVKKFPNVVIMKNL